jgi:hypothetical protein
MLPSPVIREVYEAVPQVQLIYLIRNPKSRAWSSARMALYRAEIEDNDAPDQWFIDHFKSKGSVARGDYEKCVRNWRSVFSSEHILIEAYDEIGRDPVEPRFAMCRKPTVSGGPTSTYSQRLV